MMKRLPLGFTFVELLVAGALAAGLTVALIPAELRALEDAQLQRLAESARNYARLLRHTCTVEAFAEQSGGVYFSPPYARGCWGGVSAHYTREYKRTGKEGDKRTPGLLGSEATGEGGKKLSRSSNPLLLGTSLQNTPGVNYTATLRSAEGDDSGGGYMQLQFAAPGAIADALAELLPNTHISNDSLSVSGAEGWGQLEMRIPPPAHPQAHAFFFPKDGSLEFGGADKLFGEDILFDMGGQALKGATKLSPGAGTASGASACDLEKLINATDKKTAILTFSDILGKAKHSSCTPLELRSSIKGALRGSGPEAIPETQVAGDVLVGVVLWAPAYFYYSDARLKSDVRDITQGEVLGLQGLRTVRFTDAIRGAPNRIGLLAQDVRGVYPELVGGEHRLSVDYSGVLPLLVDASRRQQRRMDRLAERLRGLEQAR